MPRAVVPDLTDITDGPDFTGWRDAQERLRNTLGNDVTFKIPQEKVWPDGVQLDPETGEPYDPTVVPISGADYDIVVKRVTVVFRPIHPNVEDPVDDQPAGVMHRESVALIASESSYIDIQDAAFFTLNGVEYRVTSIDPDGLIGIDRYVVFGEAV